MHNNSRKKCIDAQMAKVIVGISAIKISLTHAVNSALLNHLSPGQKILVSTTATGGRPQPIYPKS